MSERIHALASQLFGKPTVAACDLQEIRNLANRYPYFAPAQFLLLEKLREENSPDYNAQLQKAVLYYHNPLEFEYFIHADRFHTDLNFDETAVDEQQSVEIAEGSEKQSIVPDSPIETRNESYHEEQERLEAKGTVEVEESKWIDEEPIASWVEPEEHYVEVEGERETETERDRASAGETGEQETILAGEQREPDQETELSAREHQEAALEVEPVTEQKPSESVVLPDQHEEEPASEAVRHYPSEELASTPPVLQEETAPESSEPSFKLQTPSFGEPSADKSNPKLSSAESLAFEPFHTVDYFASQGIKLSQEELPKDKFGKQLKSFTEWLKTMKRLPATQVAASVDAQIEQKVEHMAEDSIHDPHVVTEAMAEVWIKQGNLGKALEVYQKLSLTNPSKTAYFAAKIEQLKRS